MDFTNKPVNSTPDLTPELARAIYELIRVHGNADLAFKNKGNSDYEPEHFKIVDKEADRLMELFDKHMSGLVVITPEKSHVDADTGEKIVDSPVVMWKPTTESALKTACPSDLLDVHVLVNDFEDGKTWVETKDYYASLE